LAYWRYGDYAGVGPGAHGRVTLGDRLLATRRHRAPEIWAARVEAVGHGSGEDVAVTREERAREMLLMGLRLSEGVSAARFEARTGMALMEAIEPDVLGQAIEAGYVVQEPDGLRATREGRLRLDALLGALVR
jgi:oxygen-independent coproporphyrinogen-3 oxidase